MTTTIDDRLTTDTELLTAINRIASLSALSGQSYSSSEIDAHLMLKLLERGRQSPTFADQQRGYLIRYAKFQAQHYARSGVRYARRVDEEYLAGVRDESEDVVDFDEMLPAGGPSVEEQAEQSLRLQLIEVRLGRMNAKRQKVYALLAQGYTKAEIAKLLNTSPANITQTIKRMAEDLADAE